jgi:hypothetical protein
MKFYIYISDDFSKNYLPFILYRNIIYEILNNSTEYNVNYISNLNDFIDTNDSILIMMIYCFNNNMEKNLNFCNNLLSKIILINTEYYTHLQVDILLNNINSNIINNYHIFDYNILNYKNIKNIYPNIKIYYYPLIYNKYLEDYYNNNIDRKINWKDKDIDILFYGSLNNRRLDILNKLKFKYNVYYYNEYCNNKTLFNLIERSKIVLNILYYDHNIVYDYYRNSILLANNILLITESSNEYDNIEYNLYDIENNLNICNYQEIENKVDMLMNKNEEDIKNIIDKQYNWFIKNDFKDYMYEFINNILI